MGATNKVKEKSENRLIDIAVCGWKAWDLLRFNVQAWVYVGEAEASKYARAKVESERKRVVAWEAASNREKINKYTSVEWNRMLQTHLLLACYSFGLQWIQTNFTRSVSHFCWFYDPKSSDPFHLSSIHFYFQFFINWTRMELTFENVYWPFCHVCSIPNVDLLDHRPLNAHWANASLRDN